MTFRPLVSKRLVAPYFGVVRIVVVGLMASTTFGVSVVSKIAVIDFAGSDIENLFAVLLVALVEPPWMFAVTASSFSALFVCDTNVSPVIPASVSVLNLVDASKLLSCN